MEYVPLWTGLIDDPCWKILDLPADLFRFWTLCLLAAQKHDYVEGYLPDERTLAAWIHMERDKVVTLRDMAVTSHVLDYVGEGSYKIHDWEHWRDVKDKGAARRKRAERARKKEVTAPVTDESRNGHEPVTAESRPSIQHSASSDQRSLACASDREGEPPSPPVLKWTSGCDWGPDQEAVLAVGVERWGASCGDAVVADLLRDFTPDLVRAAMDRHWDNVGEAIKPALLRGICRGIWNDGWPPKVKLKSSPKARAEPPTNQPASAFNPPPGLDAFKAKEAENLKALAEIEARKEANGRPRPV